MNSGKNTFLAVGAAIVVAIIYSSAFVVSEWETALKLRLGKIVDSNYEAGLHWRVPIINEVKKFDSRIQTLDAKPERFLTVEKKDVIVDSFAKWRIADVAQFYRSTGGDSAKTSRLLAERINTGLRNEFGKRTILEVVSGERSEIMEQLTKEADAQAAELGVEVLDVRIKQIDLPPEVSESVYGRMRTERERVARDLRAQGAESAERIQADADRQKVVIVANAYKQAEELRGEGDGRSAEIYAKAYTQSPEFYAFYRSLNAYQKVFEKGGDIMVLEPDSEFFRYFKNKEGKR